MSPALTPARFLALFPARFLAFFPCPCPFPRPFPCPFPLFPCPFPLCPPQLWRIEQAESRTLSTKNLQITVVTDLHNLSSRHLYRPTLKFFADTEKIVEDYYPEFIYRVLIIRAPAIFNLLYGMVKHVFDADTLARFEVVPGDPLPRLLDFFSKVRRFCTRTAPFLLFHARTRPPSLIPARPSTHRSPHPPSLIPARRPSLTPNPAFACAPQFCLCLRTPPLPLLAHPTPAFACAPLPCLCLRTPTLPLLAHPDPAFVCAPQPCLSLRTLTLRTLSLRMP